MGGKYFDILGKENYVPSQQNKMGDCGADMIESGKLKLEFYCAKPFLAPQKIVSSVSDEIRIKKLLGFTYFICVLRYFI